MGIGVSGIDHVGLAVSDVASSCACYAEVLGLERRYEDVWDVYPAVMGRARRASPCFKPPATASARARGRP